MSNDAAGSQLDAALVYLGQVIARLDRRRHVLSARLDLALGDRCWVAQILADPLYKPLVGKGDTTLDALVDLHNEVARIDWRKVGR